RVRASDSGRPNGYTGQCNVERNSFHSGAAGPEWIPLHETERIPPSKEANRMLRTLAVSLASALWSVGLSLSAAEVSDLGTRKQGVDWPRFLGPTGDSKSPERGIITKWPEAG